MTLKRRSVTAVLSIQDGNTKKLKKNKLAVNAFQLQPVNSYQGQIVTRLQIDNIAEYISRNIFKVRVNTVAFK